MSFLFESAWDGFPGAFRWYGFDDELTRIAFLDGKKAGYWLRSPHADDFPKDVGLVFHNGWLLDFLEDKSINLGLHR